ncbi:thioredoxin domain-containing protein [Pseudomaricurvus alcaniphilus]|uniref:DsbA family protein n=1 Tax=Pseudomaricurvus alcaniphilus TaxID=1166482 RepID=UPI00140C8AD1|nr:thioredoxin domain-containing protein [Pseudomaricurvus alcaniphilus]NHN39738.1 thioredoxin domain-containing protein [Pseudomaricurvus alcaniphilus]
MPDTLAPAQSLATSQQRIRLLQDTALIRPVAADSDHIYGSKSAAISLITYMDFNCPYCRKVRPVIMREVHTSGGKINWVFRHFPLADNGVSAEATAAECVADIAGENKFWGFAANLLSLPRPTGTDSIALIRRSALKERIEWHKLESCMSENRQQAKVSRDRAEAVQLGINATPSTVLVGGKSVLLLQGAVSTDVLQRALKQSGD